MKSNTVKRLLESQSFNDRINEEFLNYVKLRKNSSVIIEEKTESSRAFFFHSFHTNLSFSSKDMFWRKNLFEWVLNFIEEHKEINKIELVSVYVNVDKKFTINAVISHK